MNSTRRTEAETIITIKNKFEEEPEHSRVEITYPLPLSVIIPDTEGKTTQLVTRSQKLRAARFIPLSELIPPKDS